MVKAIIFDFDNTLVNSEWIKKSAYFEIFNDIKNSRPLVEEFLNSNERIPRSAAIFGILERLEKANIHKFENINKTLEKYLERYSEFVEKKILSDGNIDGSEQILAKLSQNFPLFLNSGTPQPALESIVEKKKWKPYFKKICGAPPGTKAENFKKILEHQNILGTESVIIGDGNDDREIAQASGSKFIEASKLLELYDIIKKL